MNERTQRWDRRMLGMAAHIAQWSKDPSTKTGAVICHPDYRIISMGFNGIARGLSDFPDLYQDRSIKYERIIHCEVNAVLFARGLAEGAWLFTWPFLSCGRCANLMVQAGIRRAVAPELPPNIAERWAESVEQTKRIYLDAGIETVVYPDIE